MKFIKEYFLVILFLIVTSYSSLAYGEEGRSPVVHDVKIEFIGFQNASDEAVYAHIQVACGEEYNQSTVNQSIQSLYGTGLYNNIQVRLDPTSNGQSDVTFVLDPKPRITEIFFDGNEKFSTRRLQGKIETQTGVFLDEASLTKDVQTLLEFYRKAGFSDVIIEYTVCADAYTGKGEVTFHIDEGPKRRIGTICFVGNEPCKAHELKKLMKIKEWGFIAWVSGSGRFQREVFLDDLQSLRDFYRDQGYLDVEIDESRVLYDCPANNKINITICIIPGCQYKVGEVTISGNCLYPEEKLNRLLWVKEGDVFSPSKINQTEELLRDAYGQVGYIDTYAIAEKRPNINTGAIDINFAIHESEKAYVETIKIFGNSKTKSKVILRELALAPGDIFDLVRMKNSQRRLENTRYFEEVNFIPEDTGIPGRRNLLIGLKEGRTGSLNFGVSYNNIESFVGTIEFSQSNFDIMNYQNWFQGGGQKFRVKGRYGDRSKEFNINFEEPWLCERELAFGTGAYFTQSNFNSSLYNEARLGFETYLRKRLFGLVDGQLGYTFEEVNIKDVSPNASDEIKKEAGKKTISKLGLSLSYDTRDNFVYPTQGTTLGTSFELAGGPLGGETKYTRLSFTAAQWFPLYCYCDIFRYGEQVLLLGGRIATIMPYGGQRVPYYDRFFLGGPQTLRGYDFRAVGPKDSKGEPIGGNSVARLTAEYSVKVIDPVRFVVFYDWGICESSSWEWPLSKYNDDWGIGLRIFVMGAPLRLDWGFPIHGDGINDRKTNKFNISFGTTF